MGSDSTPILVKQAVRHRIPCVFIAIDYLQGDRLVYNTLHHAIDHPLFLQAIAPVGIIRFQLIAKSPVRYQLHIVGKQLLALFIPQFSHVDVVVGYIRVGLGNRLRDMLLDCSRDSGCKPVSHTGIRPIFTRPVIPLFSFFCQGVEGKIQRGNKCDFIAIEIIGEMCRSVVTAKHHVHRRDLGTLQLNRFFQVHIHLVVVTVDHFKIPFQRTEKSGELRRIAQKRLTAESRKFIFRAILVNPYMGYLSHTPVNTEGVGFTKRVCQLFDDSLHAGVGDKIGRLHTGFFVLIGTATCQ